MNKKILVVDDSKPMREQVKIVLSEAGFEVIEAEDGVQGALKIEGERNLALVICDLNMPRMNGLEMLAKVKADKTSAGLPFIMLTTEKLPELKEKAKALGANAWIIKPFKAELLVAAVQKLSGA